MKQFVALLLLLCAAGTAVVRADSKPQITIVGVAHLVSKRDVYNSAFTNDPLGPKMQSQIADVLARLEPFHPTKVMIEAPFAEPKIRSEYARYLNGEFVLGANEVYQYGFHLAKAAGNTAIYPIDADGPDLYDSKSPAGQSIDAALKRGFKTALDNDPEFLNLISRQTAIEKDGTLLDLLQYLNTDEAIRANASGYTMVDRIDQGHTYAGVLNTGAWYTRNLQIYANIMSYARPGDHIVILIGQGHEYLLRDLLRLSPDVEYVDAMTLLR